MTSVGTLTRQAAFNDQIEVDGQQTVSHSHVLVSPTTSPMEADNIWLTGARWGGFGKMRLSVSYVQKKTAAKIDSERVGSRSRTRCLS
jgi:hypothetical protein